MIKYIKDSVFSFFSYVYENLEEFSGVGVSLFTFMNINILNEFIKSFFAIITALLSSYIVHELKKSNFNLVKMFKNIYRKIRRNEKKSKQNIK